MNRASAAAFLTHLYQEASRFLAMFVVPGDPTSTEATDGDNGVQRLRFNDGQGRNFPMLAILICCYITYLTAMVTPFDNLETNMRFEIWENWLKLFFFSCATTNVTRCASNR